MALTSRQDEVAAAARLIVARHGAGVVAHGGKRLAALLADYAPQGRREIRILGQALDAGAFASLAKCAADQIGFEKARLVSRLEGELGLKPDLAVWAIGLVVELATGISPVVLEPPTVEVKKPPVSEGKPPPIMAEWAGAEAKPTSTGGGVLRSGFIVLCGAVSGAVTLIWFSAFSFPFQEEGGFVPFHTSVGLTYLFPLVAGLALRNGWAALVASLISAGIEIMFTGDVYIGYLRLASGLALSGAVVALRRFDSGPWVGGIAGGLAASIEFAILWLAMGYFYYSGLSSAEVAAAYFFRLGSGIVFGAAAGYPASLLMRRLLPPAPATASSTRQAAP
jgi:hypothetical protein